MWLNEIALRNSDCDLGHTWGENTEEPGRQRAERSAALTPPSLSETSAPVTPSGAATGLFFVPRVTQRPATSTSRSIIQMALL